jgi:hypothetical protein
MSSMVGRSLLSRGRRDDGSASSAYLTFHKAAPARQQAGPERRFPVDEKTFTEPKRVPLLKPIRCDLA